MERYSGKVMSRGWRFSVGVDVGVAVAMGGIVGVDWMLASAGVRVLACRVELGSIVESVVLRRLQMMRKKKTKAELLMATGRLLCILVRVESRPLPDPEWGGDRDDIGRSSPDSPRRSHPSPSGEARCDDGDVRVRRWELIAGREVV